MIGLIDKMRIFEVDDKQTRVEMLSTDIRGMA